MRPIIALAVSLAAFDAFAASVEEAERLLDRAAPLQCEVLTMRYKAMATPAGDARVAAEKAMHQRASEVEAQLAPSAREYEAAMASLSDDDRARVRAYANGLMKDCANAASARYRLKDTPQPAR